MRRPGPRRCSGRAAAATLLVLPVVLGLLSGCGAGAVSQTASQASAVNGAMGQVGRVEVRDATIAFAGGGNVAAVYRAGSSADLNMTLVNSGIAPDRIVSISSPIAARGVVTGDPLLAPGQSVQVGNNTGASSGALADRTIGIKLVGLKKDIRSGLNYPVVFRFEKAGELTVELPVGYPTGPLTARK